jgi:hypothetical protein
MQESGQLDANPGTLGGPRAGPYAASVPSQIRLLALLPKLLKPSSLTESARHLTAIREVELSNSTGNWLHRLRIFEIFFSSSTWISSRIAPVNRPRLFPSLPLFPIIQWLDGTLPVTQNLKQPTDRSYTVHNLGKRYSKPSLIRSNCGGQTAKIEQ